MDIGGVIVNDGSDIMLYRIIIKKETKNYFIGKNYNKKIYKIKKNTYSKNLYIGADVYIYAICIKKFFYDVLIPISDEEAGVINNI